MTWLIGAGVAAGALVLARLGALMVLVNVLTIAVWALAALALLLPCLTAGVFYFRKRGARFSH